MQNLACPRGDIRAVNHVYEDFLMHAVRCSGWRAAWDQVEGRMPVMLYAGFITAVLVVSAHGIAGKFHQRVTMCVRAFL